MKHFLVLLLLPCVLQAQHFGNTKLILKPLPNLPAKDAEVLHFLQKNNVGSFTQAEQEWFYWTNYSRINPKRFWDSVVAPLINIYPQFQNEYAVSLQAELQHKSPLPLLRPNQALRNVAWDHAEALASKQAPPSHTSPNGNTFQTRMAIAGIKKCAGENISFGPPNTVLGLVLLYLDQGVPDLGHRKSLLSANYTEMGIGVSTFSNNNVMVIQDLSCNQSL